MVFVQSCVLKSQEAQGFVFFIGEVLLSLHCHEGFSIPEPLLDKLILPVDAQINTKKEFTALCLWVKQEQAPCHNASLSLRDNSALYAE